MKLIFFPLLFFFTIHSHAQQNLKMRAIEMCTVWKNAEGEITSTSGWVKNGSLVVLLKEQKVFRIYESPELDFDLLDVVYEKKRRGGT